MQFNLNIIELILLAVSLVFIFEGSLYTIFPDYMKKVSLFLLNQNSDKIRLLGLTFCLIGLLLFYFI
jgi:uncharacterized protein YjeT (DUF2065 family)